MKIKKTIFLICGMVIILLFFTMWLFTRNALWPTWNFSETGQIGDTIGGITAPIIGLVGVVLVYLSFKMQYEANKLQQQALNEEKERNLRERQFEFYYKFFDEIKIEIQNFEFVVTINHFRSSPEGSIPPPTIYSYKGIKGITEYILKLEVEKENNYWHQNERSEKFSGYLSLLYIISSIKDYFLKIDTAIENVNDKNFLKNKLSLFYNSKLKMLIERFLNSVEENDEDAQKIKTMHEQIIIYSQ